MIESNLPKTWFNTDYEITKLFIESKLPDALPNLFPPGNFVANPVSNTEIDLTWDASVNATNYVLRRNGQVIYDGPLLAFPDTGLNPSTLYNYGVVAEAPGFTSSPPAVTSGTTGGGVSPEAQAVLDRMTGLTNNEITSITAFVDSEVLVSNWGFYDEFYCFALSGNNALTGFFNKTATAVNAPTLDVNGATFDGATNYINTNLNPSLDGSVLNNNQYGFYVKETLKTGVNVSTTIDGSNKNIFQALSSDLVYGISTATNSTYSAAPVTNETYYLVSRDAAANSELFIDGVSQDTTTAASTALVNQPMYVGCRDLNGAADSFWQGTISTFIFGKVTGFNQSAHNTNLRAFLTSLGTI